LVVGEEAGRGAIFVGWEVQAEVGSPMVTAEGCRDGFLAMIDELGEDFVILSQFTPVSA
jgi:hypothetical protein